MRKLKNLSRYVKSALDNLDGLIDGQDDELGQDLGHVRRVLVELASAHQDVSLLKWKGHQGRKGQPTLYAKTPAGTYSVTKSKKGYYCRFYLGEFPGRLGRFDLSGPPRIGPGSKGLASKGLYNSALEAITAAEKDFMLREIDLHEFARRMAKAKTK